VIGKSLYCLLLIVLTHQLCSARPKSKSGPDHYIKTPTGTVVEVTTLTGVDAETLFYSFKNETRSIPFDSVSYYYHHYHRGHGGIGFAIGAVAGTAAGVGIGMVTSDPNSQYGQRGIFVAIGGLFGLLVGGTIGAILGSQGSYKIDQDFSNFSMEQKRKYFNYIIRLHKRKMKSQRESKMPSYIR
jgi:hypothetical protein